MIALFYMRLFYVIAVVNGKGNPILLTLLSKFQPSCLSNYRSSISGTHLNICGEWKYIDVGISKGR